MPNIDLLKEKIKDSGIPMTVLAQKSGILRVTLYNRLSGVGDFTTSEVMGLTKALKLTKSERDQIFLQ